MTHQLLLLQTQEEPARARRTDPETSHKAARRVSVNPIERRVLNLLGWFREGLTTSELAAMLGISLVSVSPRMKPLEEKGKVQRTTERREHKIVWRLA